MEERPTKEHILREIKRLAAENGGKPLGVERFAETSGIREWHWNGRYWVRWSDVVREAGFEPGEWQTKRIALGLMEPPRNPGRFT